VTAPARDPRARPVTARPPVMARPPLIACLRGAGTAAALRDHGISVAGCAATPWSRQAPGLRSSPGKPWSPPGRR